MMMKKILDNR